jgi:alpha-tubulin suppressor-like RCC1 family protein
LGHGGTQIERVPRLVEALAGNKVVGAASGNRHTAVWTDTGEFFTFGNGHDGRLGHGGQEHERVPRLVEALAGMKVIGASANTAHTAVWTEGGELFTFGYGDHGQLGHGGQEDEFVPRLIEALAGKKVIGAASGYDHTAVWTEEGELFTFGIGRFGQLGHNMQKNELVPRLVEALLED